MSEKIRIKRCDIAAVIMVAAFVWVPLYMAEQPWKAEPPKYTPKSHGVTNNASPFSNDAGGVKHIDRYECYHGETVGECAGRIVQGKVAGFYVFLILFAAAQSIAAFLTWSLLRNQTRILDRQTKIQIAAQRCNIFAKGVDMQQFPTTDGQPAYTIFQMVWKNTGQISPTQVKIGDAILIAGTDKLPVTFDYPVTLRKTAYIGRDMEFKFDPQIVTNDQMIDIATGRKRLFFWGRGEYMDELTPGIVHCVEFCYRTDMRSVHIAFLPHGPHNRTYDRPHTEADHGTLPAS